MARKLQIEPIESADSLDIEPIDAADQIEPSEDDTKAAVKYNGKPLDIEPIDKNEDVISSSASAPETAPVEQVAALRDKLAKFTGQAPVQSRMNTSDVISALLGRQSADLEAAKQGRATTNLLALLEHAGETANTALNPLSGRRPDEAFTQQLLAMGNQPIQDIATKQALAQQALKEASLQTSLKNEMDKEDPTSEISKVSRQIAQEAARTAKLGIVIPEGLSAANIEKLMPGVENMANRRMLAESRQLQQQQSASDREAQQQEKLEEKHQKESSDLAQKMTTALAADKASSRSALGRAAIKEQNADSIQTLADAIQNKNQLDTRQIQEIARSLDSLLSGGAATMGGTEHLVPKSALGSGSKLMEWITSNPQGAQQGAFVTRMLDTVQREKDLAQKQLKSYAKEKLPAFNRLKDLDEDTYNQILQVHGLDEDSLKAVEKKTKSEAAHPQDDEAIAWAKANLNDPKNADKAAAILKANGL